MRKRLMSILLCLVMLFSLVPAMGVTASAAETWTTVNTYKELQDAVKAKKEYIKLGQDIDTTNFHSTGSGLEVEDWLTFENQTCTLDLNGKTLTLMTSLLTMGVFLRVYDGSNLTIKDSSSAKTGAITGAFKNYIASDAGCCLFHVHGGSSLTLENGSITVTSEPHESNADAVRAMDSNVTIKEGVTISHPGKFYPEHSYYDLDGNSYALRTDGKCKVIIDGGEFDGHVKLSGYQDTNGSIQINKGTFKKDVQVLYTAEENNSNPAVTVSGGTFEGNVYLQHWPWRESLYMPYRLNGGTFKGTVNLHADDDIYEKDKPEGNPNIALGLDKCFGYSAVVTPDGTFVGPNAYTAVILEKLDHFTNECYKMLLQGTASNHVRIIPNAWGMKSVTLDGNPIDYFKDWNGTVERMDNSTAHTLKFEWYPLAQELKDAGYTYRANFDCYTVGSNTPTTSVPISATATEYSHTIPAGEAPSVYPFDLQLNLDKNGSSVGIVVNQHIVKLVVSDAPVAPPSLTGQVYYTSGIVYGSPISIAASVTPAEATKSYQWQRSTDGGSTWTNIEGATSGKYTPVAADVGENVCIRVKVTAEGYLGEIVGAAVKVSKAANNNYPEVIKLEAVKNGVGNYTGFKITNFDSDYEYVYSTTDTPNWSANHISSATVTGLTSNTTYYVFARFKETATHTAGSIVSNNSIKLYDNVPLNRVLLEGYGSHGTIYIKKGESVTLKVSADPSNANYWSKITFKDEGATTSNIAISNGTINASTGTATPFPNGHTITITGVSTGSANLRASYPSATSSAYGTWYVVVYDDSTVANALRLESVYAYEDITLSENDTADLPINLPKLLPENSGYHLEWRILKRGTYGASYVTENDNIKLEDGKIKPKAAHAASEKAQLELVAVKDGSDTYRTLPKTSLFYVTVTEAPVIELTGVTVAPTKVNLDLNATYQLSAVKEPVNAAGSLKWESSNTGVATVDSTGKVTAKAQGTAIITVSCGDKKATCTVTVDHQHDYSGQPYLYLDPGNHYQKCTAGDGYNIEAHTFGNWMPNSDGTTQSRICTKCKHTETASISMYSVTVSTDGNGTAMADKTSAAAGTVVTLTATPDTGYHFKQWQVVTGGVTIKDNKFTMPAGNVEIKAIFEKNATPPPAPTYYSITVTRDGSGTASASITTAAAGTEITLTAKADAGYTFKQWQVVTGNVTIKDNKFTMPVGNVEVKAIFEKNATPPPAPTEYSVKVSTDGNGTAMADKTSAAAGTVVTLTATPKSGYTFKQWQVITGGVTIKDNKFTMPAGNVEVKAVFEKNATPPAPTVNPFVDVPAGSFYYDAVLWAVEKGVTTGTSATTFEPDGSCTRAQAVTFLWRVAGCPAPKSAAMPFTDVKAGSFYYDAVLWAVENGITKGTSETTFEPEADCTRAQIVTLIWRAQKSPAAGTDNPFNDVKAGSFYETAVLWAVKAGVTKGTSAVTFEPEGICTRAQIVTLIWRCMK